MLQDNQMHMLVLGSILSTTKIKNKLKNVQANSLPNFTIVPLGDTSRRGNQDSTKVPHPGSSFQAGPDLLLPQTEGAHPC